MGPFVDNLDELKTHPFVVFCQEHYNPLGLIRSLGESGLRPSLIVLSDGSIPLASRSKYAVNVDFVSSPEEGCDLLIGKYLEGKGKKPFVLTSDDTITGILDERYQELAGKAFFFNAGGPGRINELMNKDSINQLGSKHGLNVLKAFAVKRGEVPKDLEYPVITKAISPTAMGWKDDMHVCNDEQDLRDAYGSIKSEEVLLQKYIVKKNEFCLEGISVAHGSDFMVTIASTYNYYLPMSYSPYMTVGNLCDRGLEDLLKSIVAETGFEGILEIEFLVDQDDKLWFSEINFRNSTWSYASTCAGMPLPVLWASCMLKGGVDRSLLREVPEGFTAMVEIADYRQRVSHGSTGLLTWLKDFLNADCCYFIGRGGDWGPVLSLIKSVVKSKAGR